MGDTGNSMKTIYDKAKKLSQYIIELVYMQQYYLDIYHEINRLWHPSDKKAQVKRITHDTLRSYMMVAQNPKECIFTSVQYGGDISSRSPLLTVTDSYHHCKNNYKKGLNYIYIQTAGRGFSHSNIDYITVNDVLRNGLLTGDHKEAEFQCSMLASENSIKCIYLYILLEDCISNVKNKGCSIALSTLDVMQYIPAHKAYRDLLDKRGENDWRSKIKERYGCSIK